MNSMDEGTLTIPPLSSRSLLKLGPKINKIVPTAAKLKAEVLIDIASWSSNKSPVKENTLYPLNGAL